MSSINTNVYYSPSLDIINPSENVLDLGITMYAPILSVEEDIVLSLM